MKRHKIKKEKPECSFSQRREEEEHDLSYYIHDRVELMHQVFSMLKYKEIKSMAPECVKNLPIGDLQELCTEELLGISSKRLLAILDGAEPPSDTESSSPSPPPDQLETISLDSISSDEELLAASSKKKKRKHHHRNSKAKSKKKDKPKEPTTLLDENSELSKASRAGLTVLELLELQARARAIRAQLQQEQANRIPSETTAVESSHHSTDNEVEIKEEAPEIVEISSEDEKPDVNQLEKNIDSDKTSLPSKVANTEIVQASQTALNSKTVTKRVNNLIITVPQVKPTRKIKLRRNNVNVSHKSATSKHSVAIVIETATKPVVDNSKNASEKASESKSKKKKKDKKKRTVEKDGSDHDEITLQLSDSEKMDLLEDLDESRKNYDKVSSTSEDTETSSSESDDNNTSRDTTADTTHLLKNNETDTPIETVSLSIKDNEETNENTSKEISVKAPHSLVETSITKDEETDISLINNTKIINECNSKDCIANTEPNKQEGKNLNEKTNNYINNDAICKDSSLAKKNNAPADNDYGSQTIDLEKDSDITTDRNDAILENKTTPSGTEQNITASESLLVVTSINETHRVSPVHKSLDEEHSTKNKSPSNTLTMKKIIETVEDIPVVNSSDKESQNDSDKDDELTIDNEKKSDGELSDRQSSEVETIDVQPETVCISDDENHKNKQLDKKKKKKDKKSKKEKKSKKSKPDFREGADQNFYSDANTVADVNNRGSDIILLSGVTSSIEKPIELDTDDAYDIMELSDDSSCYEVEGTVLSKEPTAEEIEALSAKIDEIEREEVVTDEQIRQHEKMIAGKKIDDLSCENVHTSWKDRYLDSNKVKRVLTTANIFNALRKKNIELKKKIEDSKKTDNEEIICNEEKIVPKEIKMLLEEGSIEQYNTLQGSTKFVDPVEEPKPQNNVMNTNDKINNKECKNTSEEENVTKEMKKDAKQLLKMYKRLIKHNDMNKQKDPNKKKKKKQKKKDKLVADSTKTIASELTANSS